MMHTKYLFWPGIILFSAAVLCLTHLAGAALWGDEAYVAIAGSNLLHFGHFTCWDGRNLYAMRDATGVNPHLSSFFTMDVAVAALGFRLFGISTWAARIVFVAFGLASLGVFWAILRREFKQQSVLQCYALAALAFSTVFLLNIRTCRYYALALFFSLLLFWCYRIALKSQSIVHFAALGVIGGLLFFTQYAVGTAFLFALGVFHLIFYGRQTTAKEWGLLCVTAVTLALAVLPYALGYRIWAINLSAAHDPWFPHRPLLMWWNLRDLNAITAMPWMVAASLAAFLLRPNKTEPESEVAHTALQWTVLALTFVVFLSLFSPQPTSITSVADVRYLIPIVPFLAGLIGIFLWFVHQKSRLVAAALLLLLLSTNLLTLTPPALDSALPASSEFRWLLPAYLYEISHPYPTANEAVAQYLRQHAHQDDLVYAVPDFANYPLMFYNGDQIKLCCQLDHHSPIPESVIRSTGAPLYSDANFPNWILAFGASPSAVNALRYFSRPHVEQGQPVSYTYTLAQRLPVFWNESQRPELFWHHFGPVTDFEPRSQSVYLFHRR